MSTGTAITVKSTLLHTGYCRQIERLARRDAPYRLASFYALAVLIRHPEAGLLLFDTGYSTHFFKETSRFPYSLYRWVTPVVFRKKDALVEQLSARGISPEEIRYIFLSHFHGDHIGGVRDFPKAVFLCSREAYHHIRDKRGIAAVRNGFIPGLLPPDFSERVQFLQTRMVFSNYFNLHGYIFSPSRSIFAVTVSLTLTRFEKLREPMDRANWVEYVGYEKWNTHLLSP